MEHVFWLTPNRLCGRCGPDLQPWQARELREGGIGAVLSVAADLADPTELQAAGISHACFPLSNCAPPVTGDDAVCRDALPKALAFADAQIDRGHAVLVHCSAGKDRTGLFLAYYLACREGLSAERAIAKLRQVRPVALSAPGWEALAIEVIDGLCG